MRHPEQANDEFFAGNTHTNVGIHPRLASLKTARLGGLAYTTDGEEIPSSEMLPLFVKMQEAVAYDAIMMARFAEVSRLSRTAR